MEITKITPESQKLLDEALMGLEAMTESLESSISKPPQEIESITETASKQLLDLVKKGAVDLSNMSGQEIDEFSSALNSIARTTWISSTKQDLNDSGQSLKMLASTLKSLLSGKVEDSKEQFNEFKKYNETVSTNSKVITGTIAFFPAIILGITALAAAASIGTLKIIKDISEIIFKGAQLGIGSTKNSAQLKQLTNGIDKELNNKTENLTKLEEATKQIDLIERTLIEKHQGKGIDKQFIDEFKSATTSEREKIIRAENNPEIKSGLKTLNKNLEEIVTNQSQVKKADEKAQKLMGEKLSTKGEKAELRSNIKKDIQDITTVKLASRGAQAISSQVTSKAEMAKEAASKVGGTFASKLSGAKKAITERFTQKAKSSPDLRQEELGQTWLELKRSTSSIDIATVPGATPVLSRKVSTELTHTLSEKREGTLKPPVPPKSQSTIEQGQQLLKQRQANADTEPIYSVPKQEKQTHISKLKSSSERPETSFQEQIKQKAQKMAESRAEREHKSPSFTQRVESEKQQPPGERTR